MLNAFAAIRKTLLFLSIGLVLMINPALRTIISEPAHTDFEVTKGAQATGVRSDSSERSIPPKGLIAFAAYSQAGNIEIYQMNPDDSNSINLTKNPAKDTSPFWSPDGKKIAFLSKRTGSEEVFLMNADGSNVRQLTENQSHVSDAGETAETGFPGYRGLSWSPDGKFLLAELNMGPGTGSENRLAVIHSDGTGAQYFEGGPFLSPCWSPDGSKIAFVTYGSRGLSIAVWDAELLIKEGKVKKIGAAGTPVWEETATLQWSPDSKALSVLALNTDVLTYSILVFRADTLNQKTVYTYSGDASAAPASPVWMPDGSGIVFADKDKIHIVDNDGKNIRLLAAGNSPVNQLELSPDGQFLLFSTGKQDSQIYLLDVRSALRNQAQTRPILLTKGSSASAFSPDWQPTVP